MKKLLVIMTIVAFTASVSLALAGQNRRRAINSAWKAAQIKQERISKELEEVGKTEAEKAKDKALCICQPKICPVHGE
jgi:excinuclease UvrABC helicase subunit UvrB